MFNISKLFCALLVSCCITNIAFADDVENATLWDNLNALLTQKALLAQSGRDFASAGIMCYNGQLKQTTYYPVKQSLLVFYFTQQNTCKLAAFNYLKPPTNPNVTANVAAQNPGIVASTCIINQNQYAVLFSTQNLNAIANYDQTKVATPEFIAFTQAVNNCMQLGDVKTIFAELQTASFMVR